MEEPVFQIFIPDSFFLQLKSLSSSNKRNSIQLIGLWEKVNSSSGNNSKLLAPTNTKNESSSELNTRRGQPLSVVVTLVGIVLKNPKTGGGQQFNFKPVGKGGDDETSTRLRTIGEVNFKDEGETKCLEADSTDLSSIWLNLRISEADWTLTVDQIRLDSIMLSPQSGSVILMQFDPSLVQYVYLLDLKKSSLPSVVLRGFTIQSDLETEPEGYIPLLPKLDESSRIDQTGHFKIENSDQESTILKRCSGIKQALHVLDLIRNVILRRFTRLAVLNVVVILALDIILGYFFSSYLQKFPQLYSTLHSKIERLLEVLLQLLNWLRGSPAGLKLNTALNSLLWRFFSYHLHLWANYIGILEPILSMMLTVIIHSGFLGFTVQVSLIKDLLSMATFHVYCLYIYATRLFSVQLMTIKSLGRLFMGRKWNPLRNRVDHVQLSKSEMFLSALAFTIGIFLAPTTIVYYLVFLTLRIPLLLIESMMMLFVERMNSCEIVTNLLILTNSPRVSDEIYLKAVPTNVMLTFRICLLSTKRIIKLPAVGERIVTIFRNICQGNILSR